VSCSRSTATWRGRGLPWYRAGVCHRPPADFVCHRRRTPDYYLDSLPPTLETGRGSPVGVEFYDHHAFPSATARVFHGRLVHRHLTPST
jgi:hypothetical protein